MRLPAEPNQIVNIDILYTVISRDEEIIMFLLYTFYFRFFYQLYSNYYSKYIWLNINNIWMVSNTYVDGSNYLGSSTTGYGMTK